MKHKKLIVFPDTNSLLHYPCIKDIDWRSLCNADIVRLTLSRQVIAELDEKKSHPTLRERADRTIREIRGLLKNDGRVRDKVTIEACKKDIAIADYPPDLNHDSHDDRIVCHILDCAKQNYPIPVVIVTEDLGMELRCGTFSIEVIEPVKESRLPNPTTELDKKYAKVVQDLQTLQKTLPQIDIEITTKKDLFGGLCKIALIKPGPEPRDVETVISAKRRELTYKHLTPRQSPLDEPDTDSQMKGLIKTPDFRELGLAITRVTNEEKSRYERDLDSYLVELRHYLESEIRWYQDRSRAFKFWLKFENKGNAPADHLQIVLRINPVLQALAYNRERVGHFSKPVNEPETPTPPRSLMGLPDFGASMRGFKTADLYSRVTSPDIAYGPGVDLSGTDESGFLIEFSSRKLSHHKPLVLGPFIGIFKNSEMLKPFQIEATVTADNLPTAKQVKLNVLIAQKL